MSQDSYRIGDVVYHRTFGEGRVTDVASPRPGRQRHVRVEVAFAKSRPRWLVLAYANLQREPFSDSDDDMDDDDSWQETNCYAGVSVERRHRAANEYGSWQGRI